MSKKNHDFHPKPEPRDSAYGPSHYHPYPYHGYDYPSYTGLYPYAHGVSQFAFGLSYDIYEEEDHLVVETPFPGLITSTLEVTVENRWLRIRGESLKEQIQSRSILFSQVPKGIFDQTIVLPLWVDAETAQAVFAKGILSIRLKKSLHKNINKVNVAFE